LITFSGLCAACSGGHCFEVCMCNELRTLDWRRGRGHHTCWQSSSASCRVFLTLAANVAVRFRFHIITIVCHARLIHARRGLFSCVRLPAAGVGILDFRFCRRVDIAATAVAADQSVHALQVLSALFVQRPRASEGKQRLL
jgi:hypothetical protein